MSYKSIVGDAFPNSNQRTTLESQITSKIAIEESSRPFFIMNRTPLQLRSFKLHRNIPPNRRANLPQQLTLIYLPRNKETTLRINGVNIPSNKQASIVLRRERSTKLADNSNVVFASTDRVSADDDLCFEIWIRGKKALKGMFWRGVKWELKCEEIDLPEWAEISVDREQGFFIREQMKLRRKRFCPKLSVIPEEDEEEEEKEEEMRLSNDLNDAGKKGMDDGGDVSKKGLSWAINAGVCIACIGVGLFIGRASLSKLAGLKLF